MTEPPLRPIKPELWLGRPKRDSDRDHYRDTGETVKNLFSARFWMSRRAPGSGLPAADLLEQGLADAAAGRSTDRLAATAPVNAWPLSRSCPTVFGHQLNPVVDWIFRPASLLQTQVRRSAGVRHVVAIAPRGTPGTISLASSHHPQLIRASQSRLVMRLRTGLGLEA